jgi:hypothetical protein
MKKLILVAAATTLLVGCDKPDNYAECLIENMRGQDNIMAQVVGPYCREQFPATEGADPAAAPATEESKK